MPKSPDLKNLKNVAPGAAELNKAFSELGKSREFWRASDKATGARGRLPQAAKDYQDAK
ncbi:MAG: hypothetical protein RL326_1736, partial [Pseudomonadota bacterium]